MVYIILFWVAEVRIFLETLCPEDTLIWEGATDRESVTHNAPLVGIEKLTLRQSDQFTFNNPASMDKIGLTQKKYGQMNTTDTQQAGCEIRCSVRVTISCPASFF